MKVENEDFHKHELYKRNAVRMRGYTETRQVNDTRVRKVSAIDSHIKLRVNKTSLKSGPQASGDHTSPY